MLLRAYPHIKPNCSKDSNLCYDTGRFDRHQGIISSSLVLKTKDLMKNKISIDIFIEDIQKQLEKILISPHSKIIGKIIIGHLDQTSLGLSQLYKAMQGIDNEISWKAGMNIQIKKDAIYNSSINWDKMEEKGLIYQGYIKAQITSVNQFSHYPISYTHKCLDNKGNFFDNESSIGIDYVRRDEEWP